MSGFFYALIQMNYADNRIQNTLYIAPTPKPTKA